MIRKDQLPNIWGDNWAINTPTRNIEVNRTDAPTRYTICDNPADKPIFMLRSDADYECLTIGESNADNLHIELHEGAMLELYRLQGVNGQKYITSLEITMQAGSTLNLCTITLGGQHVRNNIVVRMKGEGCTLNADGLYLLDREQQCDNYIFVEHGAAHCQSSELYKGILDDAARARFNGHVLVQDGAIKTEAYQTNRNILLTDKAHVDTRPFLEIYNDDVKCSHGSTIGQLDEQAMFYLRTRGISERTAITMLSYAFCDEVISNIKIPSLREAVSDVVKKRLHGELSPLCDECAIPCTSPCNGSAAGFPIDVSLL